MEKGKLVKIWVTKYALSLGISSDMAEINADGDMAITFNNIERRAIKGFYHGKEWHLTEEAARKHAEEMRTRKIVSLKKQIKKLEEMTF